MSKLDTTSKVAQDWKNSYRNLLTLSLTDNVSGSFSKVDDRGTKELIYQVSSSKRSLCCSSTWLACRRGCPRSSTWPPTCSSSPSGMLLIQRHLSDAKGTINCMYCLQKGQRCERKDDSPVKNNYESHTFSVTLPLVQILRGTLFCRAPLIQF